MNKIKNAQLRTKKFVSDHRVGLAITGTSAAWLYVLVSANKGHNDFLREKGLYDEFYSSDNED